MSFSIQKTFLKYVSARKIGRLVACLSLVLLFVQSAELIHAHEHNVSQYNCDICLKLGTEDSFIAVQAAVIKPSVSASSFSDFTSSILTPPAIIANSRAPPQS